MSGKDVIVGVGRLLAALPLRWKIVLGIVAIGAILQVIDANRGVHVDGLPQLKRPVQVVTIDGDQMVARLTEAQLSGLTPTGRCRRLSLRQLRLVTQVDPQVVLEKASLLDRLKSTAGINRSVAAFYAVGHDSLFVLSARGPGVEHEMVHAYDDQVSKRMQSQASTDEALAVRAVVEGTAVDVVKGPVMQFVVNQSLDDNGWNMAYALGPAYVAVRADRVQDMVKLWPKTTYEILFGYSDTSNVVVPGDSVGSVCSDRLGALALLTLAVQGGADYQGALAAARAWRGDRVDTRLNGSERDVVWTIVVGDSSVASLLNRTAATRGLTGPRTAVHALVKDWAREKHASSSTLDSLARIQERLR